MKDKQLYLMMLLGAFAFVVGVFCNGCAIKSKDVGYYFPCLCYCCWNCLLLLFRAIVVPTVENAFLHTLQKGALT